MRSAWWQCSHQQKQSKRFGVNGLLKAVHGCQCVPEASVLFYVWFLGVILWSSSEYNDWIKDCWNVTARNLICNMLFHCRVLEKSTLLKGWVVQVSMKFSGTNKTLIKIACIMKDIFRAETVVCVTYIPKGMTNNRSLWSQDLLGQYWKCDLRMIQYREIIVIPAFQGMQTILSKLFDSLLTAY